MNKLYILLILLPVFAYLHPYFLGYKGKAYSFLLITVFSSILSILSTLFLNNASLIDGDSLSAAKYISTFRDEFLDQDDAYRFIDSNFVFIDNAHNKILIPYLEGTEGDQTTSAITDPVLLITFLKQLNRNPAVVDLLIYDVALSGSKLQQKVLKSELSKLSDSGKLLIGGGPTFVTSGSPIREDSFGNVAEHSNEDLYTSHTLKYPEMPLGMSGKLYERMSGNQFKRPLFFNRLMIEQRSNGQKNLVRNSFIPDFYLIDEAKIYSKLFNRNSVGCLDLGFAASEDGAVLLLDKLAQRKNNGQRNFIFIGAFRDTAEDTHKTIYGNLHGPTIILNIFYSLWLNQHVLDIGNTILLAVIFLLTHLIVLSRIGEKLGPGNFYGTIWKFFKQFKPLPEYFPSRNRWGRGVVHFLSITIRFIFVEILAFTILLILLYAAEQYGILINKGLVIIYFVVFERILIYFSNQILNSQVNEI